MAAYTPDVSTTHSLSGTTEDTVEFRGVGKRADGSIVVTNRSNVRMSVRFDQTTAVADADGTYAVEANYFREFGCKYWRKHWCLDQQYVKIRLVGSSNEYAVEFCPDED